MQNRHFIVVLFLLGLLALLGLGQIAAQETVTPQDLRFALTFLPNIQFSPVYVMIANGHAADAGLNLFIEYADEPIVADMVANNTIPFGVISGEQTIMARAGERPIVYIYEWYQQYPVGIVIPDTTDAETVADLQDRKIGIPILGGASYSGLIALLTANEMTEEDVQLEVIGYIAPDAICTGYVEASVIYVNNEPLQIQQRANAGNCGDVTGVSVIRVADYVDIVSNGLITNEETIANNPELIQAMITAFDNGLRDVINNPAAAYLISLEYVENLPADEDFYAALEEAAAAQTEFLAETPSREEIAASREALLEELSAQFSDETLIQFRVLLETIKLWDVEQLGYTDPASWETTLGILEATDMLPGEVSLEGAYTNDFVPPVAEIPAE